MKLSGETTLRGGVDQVYAALNDPAMLVRTIPGCQRLEQVGEATYRATVLAGVASIKGTFDGDVRLTDQQAPHSFTLHASGAGAPGTVSAVARVFLSATIDGTTLLRYEADATIGGAIGGVGQRMITGVARRNATDFFANVDRELAATFVAALEPVSAAGPVPSGLRSEATREEGTSQAPGPARAERAQTGSERAQAGSVWHAPPPVVDATRQRIRDLVLAATFGAVIALLGVIVGAIVAG